MVNQWWPILTPSALLGLAVLLVLTGRLVPRRQYEDKEHEAAEWRTESRLKDQQLQVQGEQLLMLREVGASVEALMLAMRRSAGLNGEQEAGARDVAP